MVVAVLDGLEVQKHRCLDVILAQQYSQSVSADDLGEATINGGNLLDLSIEEFRVICDQVNFDVAETASLQPPFVGLTEQETIVNMNHPSPERDAVAQVVEKIVPDQAEAGLAALVVGIRHNQSIVLQLAFDFSSAFFVRSARKLVQQTLADESRLEPGDVRIGGRHRLKWPGAHIGRVDFQQRKLLS